MYIYIYFWGAIPGDTEIQIIIVVGIAGNTMTLTSALSVLKVLISENGWLEFNLPHGLLQQSGKSY